MTSPEAPNDSPPPLVARALRDLGAGAPLIERYRDDPAGTLRELAGASLEQMMNDRSFVDKALNQVEQGLRIAGVLAMHEYWSPSPESVAQCERIALEDPDAMVRGVAVYSLVLSLSRLSDA